jgi:hypothetical protein
MKAWILILAAPAAWAQTAPPAPQDSPPLAIVQPNSVGNFLQEQQLALQIQQLLQIQLQNQLLQQQLQMLNHQRMAQERARLASEPALERETTAAQVRADAVERIESRFARPLDAELTPAQRRDAALQ